MRQRIAIDMDEVIADSTSAYIARYNEEFKANLTIGQLNGKKVRDVVPQEHRERVVSYPFTPGFFRDLPVIEGSQAVVQELAQKYEVFIATAAMEFPPCFADKFAWLQQHFPFISWANIVFCGDKSIVQADYLIDDSVRHFKDFRGEGIVFTSPFNHHDQGYRRVNSWREVRDLFL